MKGIVKAHMLELKKKEHFILAMHFRYLQHKMHEKGVKKSLL